MRYGDDPFGTGSGYYMSADDNGRREHPLVCCRDAREIPPKNEGPHRV